LATQSLIAFWDERPAEAADRAAVGRRIATGRIDLLRLASLEARARAKLGDRTGTHQAIALAREKLESADAMRHQSVFDFPAANALRCAGSAYLWLGDYSPAESVLTQALQYFEIGPASPGSYAHVAVTRVDLALAHLGGGSLDAAQEVLRPVFELSPARRLSGVVRRSRDLHAALSHPRYAPTQGARDMISAIEEFCSVTARHALSEPSG
jgi:tetratricopeptide (TPR) repeat protein